VNDAPVLTNLGATKLIAAGARQYCGTGRFDREEMRSNPKTSAEKCPFKALRRQTRPHPFHAVCRANGLGRRVERAG
jgi:hypothetical protein